MVHVYIIKHMHGGEDTLEVHHFMKEYKTPNGYPFPLVLYIAHYILSTTLADAIIQCM